MPHWYIYCPHEWEDVVAAGWKAGVSSEQITEHCCAIVRCCDLFIVGGDPKYSSGTQREMAVAEGAGIVIWQVWPLLRTERLMDSEKKILSAAWQMETEVLLGFAASAPYLRK